MIPSEEIRAPQPKRAENAQRSNYSHVEECFVCGRGITEKGLERCSWVHLINGGGDLAPVDSEIEYDEHSDLGWFPVGSDCAKHVPSDYRAKDYT